MIEKKAKNLKKSKEVYMEGPGRRTMKEEIM